MELLTNERISLRALEPEDLDILYKWENDTSLWENGTTTVPYSRFTLYEYLKNYSTDIYQDKQLRLMITLNNGKVPVGTVDLFDFDPFHSRAGVGILIDKPFRGNHLATESLKLLTSYSFKFLHLHQLYTHIPEQNSISLKLFSNNGYCLCGQIKDWLKTEKGYQSIYIMQLLNQNIP